MRKMWFLSAIVIIIMTSCNKEDMGSLGPGSNDSIIAPQEFFISFTAPITLAAIPEGYNVDDVYMEYGVILEEGLLEGVWFHVKPGEIKVFTGDSARLLIGKGLYMEGVLKVHHQADPTGHVSTTALPEAMWTKVDTTNGVPVTLGIYQRGN